MRRLERFSSGGARRLACAIGIAAGFGVHAAVAAAQSPAPADWTHGTTLNLLGGVSLDGAHASGAAGGAFGWEVTPRFAMEGTATWLARGRAADGFAADLTALVGLTPPQRIVPFVKGGVGLYRASFDPTRSPMPGFYRTRVAANAVFDQHVAFTDPTLVAGGGITAWLSRNFSVRPEVDVKLVLHDGNAHAISVIAIRVGYHFEEHPVESRRR